MKLLLDTHLLLWAAGQSHLLSQAASELLNDPDHDLLFSAASLWEVTIKRGLGRDDFRVDPRLLRRGLLDNGYLEQPITSEHAIAVALLPPRLRQTLDCLLDGDSEKQVAARLGLSRHTVHEYVKALYRRLGITTRAELMVRYLRRPPSGRERET